MRREPLVSTIALLISLILTGILTAKDEVTIQRVSFFVFSSPKFPVEVFYQKGKDKFAQLELHGANASPVLQVVNQDGRIHLHGEPEKNDEGELVYPVVGSVRLNPSTPKAFVVFFANPKSEDLRFDGRSIPVSNKDFPDGSLKFANLTKLSIRCRLGTSLHKIPPQSFQTLRYKDPADTIIGVLFQYQDTDNNWLRMISTRWRVPAKGRTIMFAYPNPKTGNPSTKSLPLPEDF